MEEKKNRSAPAQWPVENEETQYSELDGPVISAVVVSFVLGIILFVLYIYGESVSSWWIAAGIALISIDVLLAIIFAKYFDSTEDSDHKDVAAIGFIFTLIVGIVVLTNTLLLAIKNLWIWIF